MAAPATPHDLPFLVYQKALLEFKIGQASAGGIIAVILANIVAFFAMRAVGKNPRQVGRRTMARSVTTGQKAFVTVAAWTFAFLIFFPILYTIFTSFKSEQEAIAGFNLIPSGTIESYCRGRGPARLLPLLPEFGAAVGRVDRHRAPRRDTRPPGRWRSRRPGAPKDILMWMLSDKMMPAVAVLFPIYLIFSDFGLLDSASA